VAEVARRHDVASALIYTWRSKVRQSVVARDFAEAVVVAGDGTEPPIIPAAIIVELARGSRVSIFASAPPALVAAASKALR
jgi:transposase